ncbi:MAG: tetratricopeptide repeat protein [Eubacteriales bacterium]
MREYYGRYRNGIFLSCLAVTTIIIIVWWALAYKSDKIYLAEYREYVKANQLVNLNRYAEAEPILTDLSERHKDSYLVLWLYGLCLSENNKLTQGEAFMLRAREIRPALLMNQSYLVQYGDVLYRLGDYKRAERYFLESKKYDQDTELSKKAGLLLEKIRSSKE